MSVACASRWNFTHEKTKSRERKTGDIKVYSYLTVVPDEKEDGEDIDLDTEISLTDARKINKTAHLEIH